MPFFYLTPKQDDFNKISELQVCLLRLTDQNSSRRQISIAVGSNRASSLSHMCICPHAGHWNALSSSTAVSKLVLAMSNPVGTNFPVAVHRIITLAMV